MLFEKTQGQIRQFQSFTDRLDEICQELSAYRDCVDLSEITLFKQNFIEKTEDFFRSDRKFNLAVLGQVKAGKSSFLNALLFEGQNVLPKDATPKTATLTKIEYAPENKLLIEYYTAQEWAQIEALAKSAGETSQIRSARELVSMAIDNGLIVENYFSLEKQEIEFSFYQGLMEELNQYVGQNGRLTPIVKCVTLYLNIECLRHISVVDTPGLNDPIQSRTEKTRKFIEKCDAAFFLSRSSYFLDRNDLALLTTQLPQKGIRRMILIACQYDSALVDTISDWDTLDEADLETKVQLRRHTAHCIDTKLQQMLGEKQVENIIPVIEQCRCPVFFSAVAHKMSEQLPENYTPQEKVIEKGLSFHAPVTREQLKAIGNFEEVNNLFYAMVQEKDEMLQKKAASFVAVAQSDLLLQLQKLRDQLNNQVEQLESGTLRQLSMQTNTLSNRISNVRRNVEQVFVQYLAPLNQRIAATLYHLENLVQEYQLTEIEFDVDVVSRSIEVNDTKFLKPWTWGAKHLEYSIDENPYAYIDPQETAKKISLLANQAAQIPDSIFLPFQELSSLKKELFEIVNQLSEQYDAYDPIFLEGCINDALAHILFARIRLDGYLYQKKITDHYQQRLCQKCDQQAFERYVVELVRQIKKDFVQQIGRTTDKFKDSVHRAELEFYEHVLKNITTKLGEMLFQTEQIKQHVRQIQEAREILNRYV